MKFTGYADETQNDCVGSIALTQQQLDKCRNGQVKIDMHVMAIV